MCCRCVSCCLIVVALIVSFGGISFAQLEGELSGTIETGNYSVMGDCSISAGDSLLIEAGVTLFFEGPFSITVQGRLLADGSALNPILFTVQNPELLQPWHGIEFSSSAEASLLKHCIVEYATSPTVSGFGSLYVNRSNLRLLGCEFRSNEAILGGAIYVFAGSVEIDSCYFFENSASEGGAIYAGASSIEITNSIFEGNSAEFGGGAATLMFSDLQADHLTFSSNGSDSEGEGAVFQFERSTFVLTHQIFTNSYSINGTTLSVDDNSNGQIRHSLFYDNDVAAEVSDGGAHPAFGLIYRTNVNGDSCDFFSNLFLPPHFVEGGGDGNFALRSISPCIDAGDPETDLNPDGSVCDIGAVANNHLISVAETNIHAGMLPEAVVLSASPNPFNSTTTIRLTISAPGPYEWRIYSVTGQEIASQRLELHMPGVVEISWKPIDKLASGVYFLWVIQQGQPLGSMKLLYLQ
ncbi:T9SS type A sorting domain-containing protein [bacterium]|nr:T9SS type A sorting domain-containing protein [bacterium]